MYIKENVRCGPLHLLTVAAIGQVGSVKACGLDDLGSCFSAAGVGTTSPYYAGQQDAIYDHQNGISHNPIAACCHDDDWNNEFHQGYDSQWNQYQSTHQGANVYVSNSPGALVNL